LKKPLEKVFEWKNKLLAGTAVLMLGIGASQIYGSLRYGVFPANPVWLLSSLPSSQFLQRSLDNVGGVNAIALSPNGQTFVTASFGTIRIWNLRTGGVVRTLNSVHSKKSVNTVAVSPDNSLLASGGDDNNVIIWDLKTGGRIRTIRAHTGAVNAIVFSRQDSAFVESRHRRSQKNYHRSRGRG
jgi:WD40 repeat protein